jgi:hypothetical protein
MLRETYQLVSLLSTAPPFSADNTINFFAVLDRYDMDFDDDVLYCYEIQLEADLMRQGLGRLVSVSVSVFPFLSCCVVWRTS